MRRLSAFVLHATAASIMAWGWFSILGLPHREFIMAQKGGYFQFLSNQGLLIAWSSMVVSLFCDMFPSVVVVRHLKQLLLMMSLPLALAISSVHWPLILFFPHLITPLTAKLILPLTIDLALHALPLFALLVDFFVFESKFSKAYVHKAAPAAVVGFSIWYGSFVEYCATFNGFFPYPFLTNSPFPVRVLIYITIAGIALSCFKTLNALHA